MPDGRYTTPPATVLWAIAMSAVAAVANLILALVLSYLLVQGSIPATPHSSRIALVIAATVYALLGGLS